MGAARQPGHGERSREKQVLLKLAGTENMLILAVNVLAVNFLAVKSWLLNLAVPLYLRVF